MGFWQDIYELRKGNLLPRHWRRSDLLPLLGRKYRKSTIDTIPSNQSVTRSGEVRGNYVKRGIRAMAFRISQGVFELIDDPAGSGADSGGASLLAKENRSMVSTELSPDFIFLS